MTQDPYDWQLIANGSQQHPRAIDFELLTKPQQAEMLAALGKKTCKQKTTITKECERVFSTWRYQTLAIIGAKPGYFRAGTTKHRALLKKLAVLCIELRCSPAEHFRTVSQQFLDGYIRREAVTSINYVLCDGLLERTRIALAAGPRKGLSTKSAGASAPSSQPSASSYERQAGSDPASKRLAAAMKARGFELSAKKLTALSDAARAKASGQSVFVSRADRPALEALSLELGL